MKKLMELNLFSKGIFVVRAYWGNVVKHNIAPYTPTLYLAQHLEYYTQSHGYEIIAREEIL